MKNLDKIIESINKETDTKIQDLNEKTDADIEAVKKQTEYKIADAKRYTEGTIKRESDAIMRRVDSNSQMDRRKISLASKERMIDRAYSEVEEDIYDLDTADYIEFLARELCNAVNEQLLSSVKLKEMYGESDRSSTDFKVIFNEKDKKAVSKDVIAKAKEYLKERSGDWDDVKIAVSSETSDIRGGLVLKYGDIETNCSVSTIIKESKADTDTAVAKVLFG